MPKQWTADQILELARSFQPVSVLAAAADLDLFDAIGTKRLTASAIARRLHCNERGITVLLDALVALQMLNKQATRYSVPVSIAKILTHGGSDSVLAMAQHQANCLRRWDQLAKVIKSGKPAACGPSVRGAQGDTASFILEFCCRQLNLDDFDIFVQVFSPFGAGDGDIPAEPPFFPLDFACF